MPSLDVAERARSPKADTSYRIALNHSLALAWLALAFPLFPPAKMSIEASVGPVRLLSASRRPAKGARADWCAHVYIIHTHIIIVVRARRIHGSTTLADGLCSAEVAGQRRGTCCWPPAASPAQPSLASLSPCWRVHNRRPSFAKAW